MSAIEDMSAGELNDWAAYEQVYGPILPHERIDVGLAQLGLIMAQIWGGKQARNLRLRDFMPGWYRELTAQDAVIEGFESLMRMAQDAHD